MMLLDPYRFVRSAQNLLTFTEVDTSGVLTVTAPRVTFTTLRRNNTAYLYRDFGAAHFSGNILVDWDMQAGTVSSTGFAEILSFANQVGDAIGGRTNAVRVFLYNNGSNTQLHLNEVDSGVSYSATANISASTTYYLQFERNEAVGTFGTIYLRIASSAANRTNGVWITTISVALHSSFKDYRYMYALAGYNDGTTAQANGWAENYIIRNP